MIKNDKFYYALPRPQSQMLELWLQRFNFPTISQYYFPLLGIAPERQFDQMASDMKVCPKQRRITAFIHAEK